MSNNLVIERSGGVALSSGGKVEPGELLTLRATGFPFYVDAVDMVVWDPSTSEVIFDQRANFGIFGIGNGAYLYFSAPYDEGVRYAAQAVAGNQKSNIVYFTSTSTAPAPVEKPGGFQLASTLKWAAVLVAVVGVGAIVVKSGLFEAGTQAAKRKLQAYQPREA